jgi:hypothetical protein
MMRQYSALVDFRQLLHTAGVVLPVEQNTWTFEHGRNAKMGCPLVASRAGGGLADQNSTKTTTSSKQWNNPTGFVNRFHLLVLAVLRPCIILWSQVRGLAGTPFPVNIMAL